VLVVLLFVVGLQLFMLWSGGALPLRRPMQAVLVAAGAIGLILLALPVDRLELQSVKRLGRRRSVGLALGLLVFFIATAYLYFTGVQQDRAFKPSYHDEFSYILQARILAAGRLWTASPAVADFVESFQVITRPVYASVYFPGAAMVYALGIVVKLPTWMMPLVLAGFCVVLMRDIARQLFGPAAGWTAALLLVGLTIFRLQSLMVMAQIPLLLCGLAMTAVWLRWRRSPTLTTAAIIGMLMGFAAVTRPVDALCFAVPIAAAMFGRLVRDWRCVSGTGAQAHASRLTPLIVVLAATPFLVLQIIFNFGVTGSMFRTPFTQYAMESYPQTQYGFHHYDHAVRPLSPLPQKQAYYDQVARPLLQQHTPAGAMKAWLGGRFRTTLLNGVPHPLLFVLLPVGLMALRRAEVAVVVAPLLLFPLLYWPYAFFLTHYTLVTAPAVIVLALAGVETVTTAAGTYGARVKVGLLITIAAVTVVELPEFNRANVDEFFRTPQLRGIEAKLATIPSQQRALVLFRWADTCNPQEEPVYNIDHAAIDDHRIIRAHDLGERNTLLFAYFAAGQPDRWVYRYDRGDDSLTRLGTVGAIASHSH